ncbi:MAG: LysR family transcriptional regulator [Alcaligenaceae bacterium]|jgi:DNA-binding transcriptional LysR family regulator|nr:LysR family transcriptional regulator [Alcaligenaceae bacterium]
MDLKQVRYFVAVAEERSFTAAAARLHITQPPLSRQIQLLEEYLDVQLLKRDTRPIELTEAGRLFYEQSLQLLKRIEQMQIATTRLGQSYQQQLSIGFVVSTMYSGLPSLIQSFKSAYPNTRLQFLEMTSAEQFEALKSGRIDIGFGRVRMYDPAISRMVLREERLALAVPYTSPLATSNEPLTLNVLKDKSLIVYPSNSTPSFADYVLNALHDRRILPSETHEVQSVQTALGLVAAGAGYCVMPTGARIRSDLHYRLIDEEEKVSIPIIFSHRKKDSSWYIEAFLNQVEKLYEDNPELLDRDYGFKP